MRLKLEIFPNREIRASLTSEPRFRKDLLSSQVGCDSECANQEKETHETHGENSVCGRSSLDISCDFQESLKPGWGGLPRKTVFGLRAKRTLLRAGGMMERLFPKENVVFLTGTLPGSTPEAIKALACWSGYVTNLLKTWVDYYAETEHSFYCWEFQRRGALHIHYAVAIDDDGNRQLVIERFKHQWIRILEQVCAKSGVDLFQRGFGGTHRGNPSKVQAYAQTVRKSVAAYLAKYCSKGHDTNNAFYCPSRWWGVSRALLKATKEATLTLVLDSLSARKALALFQDVIHITDSLTTKSYTYPHGSGFGASVVGYHDGTVEDIDLCKTISNLLGSYSMTYSAQRGTSNRLAGEMLEISRWLLSRSSSDVCLSAPLREKLTGGSLTSETVSSLTTTDWKEIYSVLCVASSQPLYSKKVTKMKQFALKQLRERMVNEYVERIPRA